ncbi:RagB/SusD family nutrient uptake outer membrane protein [Olivibacter sp. XZL3]|uniref:RagB/SusD family nutrient uptake outer membrane protein n=1 Tax=Olivibacter sp. XZL3 TaxID=1735116 RepID=UPI001066E7F1|nr:RagB/SusD family nutrient uptake outer membrane protein [Olivibacter sp. XZL3]
MMKYSVYIALGLCCLAGSSCSDYLDAKPDSSLALTEKLADLQAILDSEIRKNDNNPDLGDVASDYYYLSEQSWQRLTELARSTYLWQRLPSQVNSWSSSYTRIFDANVVLGAVENADVGNLREADRLRIKGEALFVRAWSFYHLAQLFALPYSEENLEKPGIPLRMTADINAPTTRATIKETYDRLLADVSETLLLLPDLPLVATRPSRAASFALLSRIYLSMRDYEQAGIYADSCLQLQSDLMDYNELDTVKTGQFQALNKEVIFHARLLFSSGVFNNNSMEVDTNLYRSYAEGDLRRPLYYKYNSGGVLGFYGDYAGYAAGPAFFGISTDEMWLTRAECRVRKGDITAGLNDLNHVLANRFKNNAFKLVGTNDQAEALALVLQERYKELAFRGGIRWPDLRRLNQEELFKRVLRRRLGSEYFELAADANQYVFLIPQVVIEQTGIVQN